MLSSVTVFEFRYLYFIITRLNVPVFLGHSNHLKSQRPHSQIIPFDSNLRSATPHSPSVALSFQTNDQYLRAYVRLTRSHRRRIRILPDPSAANSTATTTSPGDTLLGATLAPASHNRSTGAVQPALPTGSRARQRLRNGDDAAGDGGDLPDSVDWRERGFRTSVKNQKSCGACFAFAVALVVEAQVFRRTGRLVGLSEQQLVDCTATQLAGNHGCAGGSLRNTLRYVRTSGGLMRDEDYPYVAAVSGGRARCCCGPFSAGWTAEWPFVRQ